MINHRESLVDQVKALGLEPRYVASLSGADEHFPAIVELIKPRGHLTLIDDPQSLDIQLIKLKALSFSWEFMFTRSVFQTDDIEKQNELLNRVSELIDDGTLISTVNSNLGKISVETLKAAHAQQESWSRWATAFCYTDAIQQNWRKQKKHVLRCRAVGALKATWLICLAWLMSRLPMH